MKPIRIIFLILITLPAFSQKHTLGIKIGPNWTKIKSKEITENIGTRNGFQGGITYHQQIDNYFQIGVELVYNQKGFTSIIQLDDGINDPIFAEYEFDHNYVSIPITYGASVGKSLFGFATIGIIPSFLVNANVTYPQYENGKQIGTRTDNTTQYVNRTDFGGLVEIGGGYKFNTYDLYTSLSYQSSFTSFTNENYLNNTKIKQAGLALSVGLKFTLP